ncbi:MAG: GntR family transcriptional regulator [Phycisphaerae bacterium]|nr:GntR family transcriptional regulator [Phycisphaerae bacterium]
MKVLAKQAPKYRRMADRIERGIRSGKYSSGHAIPSVRGLMKSHKLSMSTVVKALGLLEQRGLVRRMRNRGYFVVDRRRPDPKLRQIALVTPALAGDTQLLLRGLTNSLSPDGNFSVGVYSSNADLLRYSDLIEQVIRTRPAGIVLNSLPREIYSIPGGGLRDSGIATVVIGQRVENLPRDRVDYRGEESANKFMPYLLEKGCRDFTAVFVAPLSDPSRQGLLKVIRERLAEVGGNLPDGRVFALSTPHGYMTPPDPYLDAQIFTESLLRRGVTLGTVVCCHDYPAVGVLRAVLAAGLRVPEDVRIVSASLCPVEGVSPMKLTTVDTHHEERARLAGELLRRRMNGYEGPPEVHYNAGDLIPGQTA